MSPYGLTQSEEHAKGLLTTVLSECPLPSSWCLAHTSLYRPGFTWFHSHMSLFDLVLFLLKMF